MRPEIYAEAKNYYSVRAIWKSSEDVGRYDGICGDLRLPNSLRGAKFDNQKSAQDSYHHMPGMADWGEKLAKILSKNHQQLPP